jgi:uncharacterized protein YdhG (YjbR/CyaY superfamily)
MMSDHDAYIAKSPEDLRPLLEQVRTQLSSSLPDADEVMKYDMPGFQVGGSIVAGYGAFSRQCGLYLSPGAIRALADDIAAAGLKATKSGVTFSVRRPIPGDLVRRLAQASRKDFGV